MIYKEDCIVMVELKPAGDGMGSGYTCRVFNKDKEELLKVTPVGRTPQDCFNTLMTMWNYYFN